MTGKEVNFPDVASPIYGVRAWQVARGNHLLLPLAYSFQAYAWVRGKNTARHRGDLALHEAPGKGCACGFWAWKEGESPPQAQSWQSGFTGTDMRYGTRVLGRTKMWGTVFVHEYGFRSQYAQVVELLSYPDMMKSVLAALDNLAEVYGVPVGRAEDHMGLAQRFGLTPKWKE